MDPATANGVGDGIKQAKQSHSGDLVNFPEGVNLNAYQIDLSESHIYKYAIEFEPKHSFSHREKKQLARMFLSVAGVDSSSSHVVVGDNFEIFLPFPNLHLTRDGLQVPFARLITSNGTYSKILIGDSAAKPNKFWPHFRAAFDVQMKTTHSDPDSKVPTVVDDFQYCKVSAQGSRLPLKDFHENENDSSQGHVLGALDKIFVRDATVPPNGNALGKFGASTTLLAMGNKIFDLSGNPLYDGESFQLRVGIKTSTQILDGGIFRIVSPTYRAFLTPMNLAELGLQFCKQDKLDGDATGRLEELLKGVTVKRNYGNGRVDQITGLGQSPSVQQLNWGGRGRISVEDYMAQEHGHKIHSSYAHLPCVKVGNTKMEQYLPMSVYQILPGQKVQLLLLMETGVLTKAELKTIEIKGRKAAEHLQDKDNEFGRNFLYRAMSPETFAAFNIKINTAYGSPNSLLWNRDQVKQPITIPSRKLRKSFKPLEVPNLATFKGLPLAVVLLMEELPKDYRGIVAQLFDSYKMELREIFVLGENLGLDGGSLGDFVGGRDGSCAHREGVLFILRSKADSKKVGEAYQRIKAKCESAKRQMAAVSVGNLSVSPQTSGDIEEIGRAFQRLLSKSQNFPNSVKAPVTIPQSKFSCVAVYVGDRDQADGKFVAEKGTMTTRRQNGSRNFFVTLAAINSKTGSFESRAWFQTCDAGAHPAAGNTGTAGRKSIYPGAHCIKADDVKEMRTFIQSSMSGSEKTRLIIFRAGVLPSEHGAIPSGLDSEISFFDKFAKEKGYSMAYYSTSSSSGARLTPPSQAPELTHSALVVQPVYANSKKWLIQKETPQGCPAGPILLTLHRGDDKIDKDFFGPDSAVFSALWSFPPDVRSAKELGPVAVARKTTRGKIKDIAVEEEHLRLQRQQDLRDKSRANI